MSTDIRELEHAINAVLDGDATTSESEAAELAASQDECVERYITINRHAAETLQSSLDPSPAVGRIRGFFDAQSVPNPWVGRFVPHAAAAAVLLSALGYLAGSLMAPGPLDLPPTSPHVTYNSIVSRGFTPGWVCDASEFPAKMNAVFGEKLYAMAEPGDVEMLGWSYARIPQGLLLSQNTMALLARAQGHNVILFIDRVQHDRPIEIPPGSGLTLHRREVGGFVLYEVSPLTSPSVAPLIVAQQ